MTDDEAKQLIKDYKETFSTEGDKRVLADLKRLAKINMSIIPYDLQRRIDPMAVMRNEGQRSVIVHIYTKLNKDPYEERQKIAKG